MNHKILSLLGLAARSRNLVSGEFAVEKSVKSGHAYLVLAAKDASENTKKMYQNMCEYYHVPLYFSVTEANWATPSEKNSVRR